MGAGIGLLEQYRTEFKRSQIKGQKGSVLSYPVPEGMYEARLKSNQALDYMISNGLDKRAAELYDESKVIISNARKYINSPEGNLRDDDKTKYLSQLLVLENRLFSKYFILQNKDNYHELHPKEKNEFVRRY